MMSSDYYDVKIKRFPDGTVQYRANLIIIPYNNFVLSPGSQKERKKDPIRSCKNSFQRTVDRLYDIVHSNNWDYFFTLTLDPKKVDDRYDFNICAKYIHNFTDLLYRSGGLYVIVPERHKDGAWHYHGLVNSIDDSQLSVNANGFLEFKSYHYGYCSLSSVIDTQRAANYILKYMIKGYNYLDIPKGKKRYWASRGLQSPEIEYDVFTQEQIDAAINESFYYKKIDNDFYNGYIIDVREF